MTEEIITQEDFIELEDLQSEIQALTFHTLPDVNILKEAIRGAFRVQNNFERKEVIYKNIKYQPQEVLYVTDLIYCIRRKCFELISRLTNISDDARIRIAIGSLLHSEIQKRMFANASFEKKFMKDYNGQYLLIGKVDCLIQSTVIDFKIKISSKKLKTPEPYHIDQLQLYMWLTDTENSYLVIIYPSSGEIDVFHVKRDENRIYTLLERGLKLVQSLSSLVLPDPEPRYSWECKDCVVSDCLHKS